MGKWEFKTHAQDNKEAQGSRLSLPPVTDGLRDLREPPSLWGLFPDLHHEGGRWNVLPGSASWHTRDPWCCWGPVPSTYPMPQPSLAGRRGDAQASGRRGKLLDVSGSRTVAAHQGSQHLPLILPGTCRPPRASPKHWDKGAKGLPASPASAPASSLGVVGGWQAASPRGSLQGCFSLEGEPKRGKPCDRMIRQLQVAFFYVPQFKARQHPLLDVHTAAPSHGWSGQGKHLCPFMLKCTGM